MYYKQSTQVPNFLFDTFLPLLTAAELKVALIIIRQTIGWLDRRTGQRKTKDRISASQFKRKTGLSQRCVTNTIQSLLAKNLIRVTDRSGAELRLPRERKGKSYLYYAFTNPAHFPAPACAQNVAEPAHQNANNKTNRTKLTHAKLKHISELLPNQNNVFKEREN